VDSSSTSRMASVIPPPPNASNVLELMPSGCLRKRLHWCIIPSSEAARINRSVGSTVSTVMDLGKTMDVKSDRVGRSHIWSKIRDTDYKAIS